MSEPTTGPHSQELLALATRLRNVAQHFPSPQREQVDDAAAILKERGESMKKNVPRSAAPRSAA